jgi:hypothetical protein
MNDVCEWKIIRLGACINYCSPTCKPNLPFGQMPRYLPGDHICPYCKKPIRVIEEEKDDTR